MRKKIFLFLLFLFAAIVTDSIYETNKAIHDLSSERAKEVYLKRIKEYDLIYNNKTHFLMAFAKFLSTSKPIINAYIENNRTKIINFVLPLYKNLYPDMIEEIHFFKPPVISFVNFFNLKAYDINLSNVRRDILWVDTSFKPSVHFYICRIYPGLRATYPIIYKNRLLGSLSFGMNIDNFKKMFLKLGVDDASIYLNDNYLKNFLRPVSYSKYDKLPEYKGYRVNGKIFHIALKPGYEIHDYNVYTKILIKDFFNHDIALIVTRDNIKNNVKLIENEAIRKLFLIILSYMGIFTIIYVLFSWLLKKLNYMNEIVDNIKHHKFDHIPKKIEPKEEFDVYQNNLIDLANEIQAFIKILSKKIQKYSTDAYIDPLTKAYNRRFLEEKDKETILKKELSNINYSVIMFDIDDFKKINDTYGHDVGDIVLQKLAEVVRNIIRKEDLFIRYGGEEFLIILHDSDIFIATQVAEKIRKSVEEMEIKISDTTIKFTVSLGVSEVRLEDRSIFETIKRADINLYKAKKNGKNRVEF